MARGPALRAIWRWRALLCGLVCLGLVACGGTPVTSVGRRIADAPVTPTVRVTAAIPLAPTAPIRATASAGPVPTTAGIPTAGPSPTAGAATPAGAASTPSPAAAANPTAAPSSAPSTPAAAGAPPAPRGTIPAGWQIYRGPRDFPIVFAFPPDWSVDTTKLADQYVIFVLPNGGEAVAEGIQIYSAPDQTEANIDVLRDEFFAQSSYMCEEKGIEYTERRQIADATFAILGATCGATGDLSFLQVASGLKAGDEWSVAMLTPYASKEGRLREIFDPFLATITIYGKIEGR